MKKQLQKKFYACLPALRTTTGGRPLGMAFIIMMMFSIVTANAQIVYTDVIPDTTIANSGPYHGFYYLDLNNDGISDDSISYRVSGRGSIGACGGRRVSISALNGNAVAGSTPLAMNLNDTISSGLPWSASGDLRHIWYSGSLCTTINTSGNWTDSIDHYLGLKLIVGNDTYYGWVRMKVNVAAPNTALGIIKDYAYNSTPNQFILAGDNGTGPTGIFETITSSSINLFPNPATNFLTITLPGKNKTIGITIIDITGKIIYTTVASETQKIEVNTSDFAKGIYIVQIQAAGFVATKKLVVEK